MSAWLRADQLTVVARGASAPILSDISFTLQRGARVGLVGASGSGKSTLALALLGLLPARHFAVSGVLTLYEATKPPRTLPLHAAHPDVFGAIFQDPSTSLNPFLRIEQQLREVPTSGTRAAQTARIVQLLTAVGISDAAQRLRQYPHALSGGQRQRVALAMALLQRPGLLLADEPTTALDATVQADVLACVRLQCQSANMGLLLITHDLSVVAHTCEQIWIMHQGRIVEQTSTQSFLAGPAHPHAAALLSTAQAAHAPADRPPCRLTRPRDATPALTATQVVVQIARADAWPWQRKRTGDVLRGVDCTLWPGEVVALVGESGAGKSTFGRALAGLAPVQAGRIARAGAVQLVWQNPKSSLDPQQSGSDAIDEAIELSTPQRTRESVAARRSQLLAAVGLSPEVAKRRPAALSGGQAQRVALARALAARPAVLVADEATSALDPDSRRQVLALLARLAHAERLAVLLITHDLAAVAAIASRALTLYAGRLVETAPAERLMAAPLHPYTQMLVRAQLPLAAPTEPPAARLPGEVPGLFDSPPGCAFAARCPSAAAICTQQRPALRSVAQGRQAACHFVPQAPQRSA